MKENDNQGKLKGVNREHLEHIKRDIPIVKSLHHSFWENPQFLRWQLVRLNKDYQRDLQTLWTAITNWKNDALPNFRDTFEFLQDIEDIKLLDKDFPPNANDIYGTWVESIMLGEDHHIFNRYSGEIISWHGRIFNATHDLFFIEVEVGSIEKKQKLTLDPSKLGLLHPSPIPWHIRFPFISFLATLPGWPKEGKSLKGRPQDWATNLLVYELSQAGLKNMETARLLFGVKKSTENWPDETKHPILVRIAKIKRTMEKIVSESYPLI